MTPEQRDATAKLLAETAGTAYQRPEDPWPWGQLGAVVTTLLATGALTDDPRPALAACMAAHRYPREQYNAMEQLAQLLLTPTEGEHL